VDLPEVAIGRDAVRVGDTVRRRCGEWCEPVHAFLRHLREEGFEGAPEVLQNDDQDREVLRWVEGESGLDLAGRVRADLQTDEMLVSMGEFIRAFHDASATFRWEGREWQELLREPNGSDEVVCHNDISYSNTIFRGTSPASFIDWEFAAPGSRLWDLAYASWWLVPLHRPECYRTLGWNEMDQPKRFRLFCDAYDLGEERSRLLDVIHARQLTNQRQLRTWVASGLIPAYDEDDPTIEVGRTDYLDSRRSELQKALLE
jgi:hypothetical protein